MNIYGKKVVLRAIEPEDNELLLSLLNDPETERALGGASYPASRAQQEKWLAAQGQNDSTLRCIVALKESPERGFGTVILSGIDRKNGVAQIHIKLAPEGRGFGVGADAIAAMVEYAFREQRLHCITAGVLHYNISSQKTFEKCGFQKEGVLRGRVYKDGGYQDLYSYSIVKGE